MVGDKIYPKCSSPKFASALAGVKKGKRGRMGGKSEYGSQLVEKQKVRFTYGLTERQFSNEVRRAQEHSGGNASDALYRSLEMRLDNVVYRLGLAPTRFAARQMVGHGHITVDGKKVSIPSSKVKLGSVIGIREGSAGAGMFSTLEERLKGYAFPDWLAFDVAARRGTVRGEPLRAKSLAAFNIPAVLEFYSRA